MWKWGVLRVETARPNEFERGTLCVWKWLGCHAQAELGRVLPWQGVAQRPGRHFRRGFSTQDVSPHFSVRREKAQVFSGWNSRLATVAPASSNRGGCGGDEATEASGVEGRLGRLGERTGRNVSER